MSKQIRNLVELDPVVIIRDYLSQNGFDGLFYESECGCELSDLAPCCEDDIGLCCPGYKVPCDCGDHDFHISAEKP